MNSEQPKIDIHIHLASTGCNCSGGWISPSLKKRYTIKLLQLFHSISNQRLEQNFDGDWVQKITELISDSEVDYGVILGFDGAADAHGELDLSLSQMIIPPEWVFKQCEAHSNLLPGPSINPHSKDALQRLDYCIENKAVLIKWLPSAQLINPADPTISDFYQKLAKSEIPLLIHCGGEKTFKSLAPEFNDISKLVQPLEYGVKVICAHSATRVLGSKEKDHTPQLLGLLKKYENLWVDNSGICNPSRHSHLPRLAETTAIAERTLYGSDWPVPANAVYYLKKLGFKKVYQLESIKNWINRDIEIKRLHGFSDLSLRRANAVLANLDYWTNRQFTNEQN